MTSCGMGNIVQLYRFKQRPLVRLMKKYPPCALQVGQRAMASVVQFEHRVVMLLMGLHISTKFELTVLIVINVLPNNKSVGAVLF
jgi:hypothetical protein